MKRIVLLFIICLLLILLTCSCLCGQRFIPETEFPKKPPIACIEYVRGCTITRWIER